MHPDNDHSYYHADADETDLRTALIRLTGNHRQLP